MTEEKEELLDIAITIIDIFEEYLNEKNITIASNDREGDSDEARIFGSEYYELENAIIDIISKNCNPDVSAEIIDEFNGLVSEKLTNVEINILKSQISKVLKENCILKEKRNRIFSEGNELISLIGSKNNNPMKINLIEIKNNSELEKIINSFITDINKEGFINLHDSLILIEQIDIYYMDSKDKYNKEDIRAFVLDLQAIYRNELSKGELNKEELIALNETLSHLFGTFGFIPLKTDGIEMTIPEVTKWMNTTYKKHKGYYSSEKIDDLDTYLNNERNETKKIIPVESIKEKSIFDDKLKDKMVEELYKRFLQIQKTTKLELTVGNEIQEEAIGNNLHNIAITIYYTKSGRKHKYYLNFTQSETFKSSIPEFNNMRAKNHSEFEDFIDSIRKELLLQIENKDKPIHKKSNEKKSLEIDFDMLKEEIKFLKNELKKDDIRINIVKTILKNKKILYIQYKIEKKVFDFEMEAFFYRDGNLHIKTLGDTSYYQINNVKEGVEQLRKEIKIQYELILSERNIKREYKLYIDNNEYKNITLNQDEYIQLKKDLESINDKNETKKHLHFEYIEEDGEENIYVSADEKDIINILTKYNPYIFKDNNLSNVEKIKIIISRLIPSEIISLEQKTEDNNLILIVGIREKELEIIPYGVKTKMYYKVEVLINNTSGVTIFKPKIYVEDVDFTNEFKKVSERYTIINQDLDNINDGDKITDFYKSFLVIYNTIKKQEGYNTDLLRQIAFKK